jgi:hypothetical protein
MNSPQHEQSDADDDQRAGAPPPQPGVAVRTVVDQRMRPQHEQ